MSSSHVSLLSILVADVIMALCSRSVLTGDLSVLTGDLMNRGRAPECLSVSCCTHKKLLTNHLKLNAELEGLDRGTLLSLTRRK